MSKDLLALLHRVNTLRMESQQRALSDLDSKLTEAKDGFTRAQRNLDAQKERRATDDDAIGRKVQDASVTHAILAHARLGYEAKQLKRDEKRLAGEHAVAVTRQADAANRYRDLSRRHWLTNSLIERTRADAGRRSEQSDEMELEESTKPSLRRFDNEA